jgi:hypothetical protein
MGKIIYLVTSGSYSDYGIDAAFSTEAKANQYIAHYKDNNNYYMEMGIEEYELDVHTDRLDQGYLPYMVQITYGGDVLKAEEIKRSLTESGVHFYGRRKDDNTHLNLSWYGQAKSKEHAIKIASEKRSQAIALNMWGDTGFNKVIEHEEANQSL